MLSPNTLYLVAGLILLSLLIIRAYLRLNPSYFFKVFAVFTAKTSSSTEWDRFVITTLTLKTLSTFKQQWYRFNFPIWQTNWLRFQCQGTLLELC